MSQRQVPLATGEILKSIQQAASIYTGWPLNDIKQKQLLQTDFLNFLLFYLEI